MRHTRETIKAQRGLWVMIAVLAVVMMIEPRMVVLGDTCADLLEFIGGQQ